MKNELMNEKEKDYEDEIDLVDLLKILIRNKGMIFLITVIITAFSIGGALYIRSNRIEKFGLNFTLRNSIDSYYEEKAQLEVEDFNVEEMFLDDNIVDEFYADEDFNKYYFEKTRDKKTTSDDKREFLQDSLELKKVTGDKEKFKYYTLNTTIEDEVLSKKMIELYLNIVNMKKTELLKNAIEDEISLVFQRRDLYRVKVREGEKQIAEIIKKQPVSILENQSMVSILTITNPTLLQELNSNKKLYEKYDNQALGLEGVKGDKKLGKQIEKISSVYKVEEKSKSKMIVAIGMILGLFLGIFAAFIKEFIKGVDWK
ncbi:hypothetical protein NRK67_04975 [Fusobacteria bacterium ZRK30]|nr:hypothetical protein NRK67_04975 [Fusobacteria bacterium ZRK30]